MTLTNFLNEIKIFIDCHKKGILLVITFLSLYIGRICYYIPYDLSVAGVNHHTPNLKSLLEQSIGQSLLILPSGFLDLVATVKLGIPGFSFLILVIYVFKNNFKWYLTILYIIACVAYGCFVQDRITILAKSLLTGPKIFEIKDGKM